MVIVFDRSGVFQYTINELTLDMIEDDGGLTCIEVDGMDISAGGEYDLNTKRPVLNEAKDGVTWEDFTMPVPTHPDDL